MHRYGQFCPVAKSAELIGDPWSILIVRELLLGSHRFSVLQRGLPKISPTVLNTRLKSLETNGIITRRRINGQRGHEYQLTPAGRELAPVIESLVVWGMRWARDRMDDEDMDVTFLMFDIQRNLKLDELPGGETVLCFQFPDLKAFSRWWLVCRESDVDLCYENPGKDVHAWLSATSRDLVGIWMGDITLAKALDDDRLTLQGDRQICRSLKRWFPLSSAAAIPRRELS